MALPQSLQVRASLPSLDCDAVWFWRHACEHAEYAWPWEGRAGSGEGTAASVRRPRSACLNRLQRKAGAAVDSRRLKTARIPA